MIITKTPFRISFFGGGTDYPNYYRHNNGAVLSTSIDKYCYIQCRYLPPFFNYKYRIRYTTREETKTIDEIQHPAVRECIRHMNIQNGIEMVHTSDIPAQSGMGSSSAFTVGFLKALHGLKGNIISKNDLANQAIHIEQNIINENIGSQDQISASFGGLNKIDFINDTFYVSPITITKERMHKLHNHLLLFFTGFSRTASEVAKYQISSIPYKQKELQTLYEMVFNALDILTNESSPITEFGYLLDESWKIKRSLTSKITNEYIDNIYSTSLDNGAIGGKLLGAGNGGCMLLFAKPQYHDKIINNLSELSNQTSYQISNQTPDQISNQTSYQISNQTSYQISNQTSYQISNQTPDQISNQTPDQISNQTSNQIIHIPFKFENKGSDIIYYEQS